MIILRRVAIILILLGVFAAFPVYSRCEPSDPQKTVLSNGLVLISKKNASSDIVAVDVFIKAGARYDPRGKAGLSCLVSRLLLNSFSMATGKEALSALDDIGGSIQVLDQQDYMEIYYVTTADQLEPALRQIVDFLKNATFDEGRVAAEKKALAEEVSKGDENWFPVAYQATLDRLYKVSPYRRPIAGDAASIAGLTLEDVEAFYNAYFAPNNVVISIVGNVDHMALTNKLTKIQVDYYTRKVPRVASPVDEGLSRSNSVLVQREGNLAYLMVAFQGPGIQSSDYPAAAVLDVMVGGGKASKLFQAFRESEGIGYELGTVFPSMELQSHFVGYLSTDPYGINLKKMRAESLIDGAKNRLVEQFTQIREGKFTDEELRRAKRFAIGSYALRHQRMKEQAYFLGWYEAMGLGYKYDQMLPEKIEAITRADVLRVATRYLDNYIVSVMVPTK